MKFNASPVHDVQLAAPMHVIWLHHQKANDDRHAIKLAACASYICGYHCFTALATSKEEELLQSEHPLIKYYHLAIDQFNGVAFRDPQVGHINPTCDKFVETFIDDRGKAIKTLVDSIVVLLEWIKGTVGTANFNHVNIEKWFKECIKGWHDNGFKTFDIGEFQLMICIQICCYASIIVKGHKDLHNVVYPVASLGAAAQLEHIFPSKRPYVQEIIMGENGLEDYGLNGVEGSLCKTSESRVGKIFDYVFRYQHQFCIGKDGGNLVKCYNSDKWEHF
jgi:hypothetical protein